MKKWTDAIFILGAADAEMQMIDRILRSRGARSRR